MKEAVFSAVSTTEELRELRSNLIRSIARADRRLERISAAFSGDLPPRISSVRARIFARRLKALREEPKVKEELIASLERDVFQLEGEAASFTYRIGLGGAGLVLEANNLKEEIATLRLCEWCEKSPCSCGY